ncbi:unnamed protein product [Lota lota]
MRYIACATATSSMASRGGRGSDGAQAAVWMVPRGASMRTSRHEKLWAVGARHRSRVSPPGEPGNRDALARLELKPDLWCFPPYALLTSACLMGHAEQPSEGHSTQRSQLIPRPGSALSIHCLAPSCCALLWASSQVFVLLFHGGEVTFQVFQKRHVFPSNQPVPERGSSQVLRPLQPSESGSSGERSAKPEAIALFAGSIRLMDSRPEETSGSGTGRYRTEEDIRTLSLQQDCRDLWYMRAEPSSESVEENPQQPCTLLQKPGDAAWPGADHTNPLRAGWAEEL